MLIIQLKKGESIEKALKRYKRKYQKTKVHQQLRDGKAFTKPSVKRRKEKMHASYIQQIKTSESNNK